MKGNATRLMLAIQLHRIRTGRWPSTLNELDADSLSPFPHDIVSGASFGYRVEGDEVSKPSYVLYSFGMDGTDNGGKSHDDPEKRHKVLTHRTMNGFDFVVNHSRPDVID
jgi:hypothetical protein